VSKQVANVHDAFFKQVLSDPMLAGAFLREHLPPDVASLLSTELPEPIPGSFVDEELRQHHSDLLFRVHLKRGPEAYAYVLMEHKSSRDPAARLQLLRYVVRVLLDWYERNKQQLPLPPVLPLLAHQGPGGWEISCEFADLFGTVPERKERIMGWLTQPYYDKGLAEGEARGEARGKAAMLTRHLEKRFGALPEAIRRRIFSADVGCIEAWAERAFDVPDLQSVFDAS
jgi:predicted transposase YdaD